MKKFWLFVVLFIATFTFACIPKVSAYQSTTTDNRFYTSFDFDSIEIIGDNNFRFVSDSDTYFTRSGGAYDEDNILVTTAFENVALYKYYNYIGTNQLEIEYSFFTIDSEVQDITRLFVYSSETLFNINDTFRIYSDSNLNNFQISFRLMTADSNEVIRVNEYKNNIQYFDLTEYIVAKFPDILNREINIFSLYDVNINIRPQTNGSIYILQNLHSVSDHRSLLRQWLDEYVPPTIIQEEVDVSNWIMQIFKTFDRFLAIKFGDVSIGGILLIPLILSIVFVILRIWRGGSA